MLTRVTPTGELIPLPSQVAFWHLDNYSEIGEGTSEPQFLTCLKATAPGDRQIVWQGRAGGLTAVVDFGEPLRRDEGGLYYRWGCITTIWPPVVYEAVAADPVLSARLTGRGGRALQGKPVRLTDEESHAIDGLIDLPPFFGPLRDADGSEIEETLERWGPLDGLDPEVVIEAAVANQPDLWRALGFPEEPLRQYRLPSGGRPDLLASGVVGEAKRVVRLNDGPDQIERYIRELEAIEPFQTWRGILLQTIPDLDTRTTERIRTSEHDIEVWSVLPTSFGRMTADRIA